MYAFGESEEIVGAALQGRRDDVVLATKFHNQMGPDQNQRGNSRRWIMKAVDDSLRRLQTDWIDLYQVHRPDPLTAIDETVSALSDLVRSGKIRYGARRPFPPPTWSTRSGRPNRWEGSRRIASSRPTRSSAAASSVTCSPHVSATEWACSRGARSRADGSRASTGATLPHRRAAVVRPIPITSTA